MSVKTIPSQTIVTCDCCGIETDNGLARQSRRMKTHLKFEQDALDFQGMACANGTVEFDFCDQCARTIREAINHAMTCIREDDK